MKAQQQRKVSKPKKTPPLYESIWLALFIVLRQEWLQYRNQI